MKEWIARIGTVCVFAVFFSVLWLIWGGGMFAFQILVTVVVIIAFLLLLEYALEIPNEED